MGWENEIRNSIKKGNTYRMGGIGKVKVIGNVSQYGGKGSGGALFVKCKIVESVSKSYKIGDIHELNAEFMY